MLSECHRRYPAYNFNGFLCFYKATKINLDMSKLAQSFYPFLSPVTFGLNDIFFYRDTRYNLSQENVIKVSILLDKVHDVLQHLGSNPLSTVRSQAPQSHDVQLPLVFRGVNATADSPHHDVIVVS